MRAGTSMSSMAAQSLFRRFEQRFEQLLQRQMRRSKCTCSERMPGVRSTMPCECCAAAATASAHARGSAGPDRVPAAPYSIEQVAVAGLAVDDLRPDASWRDSPERSVSDRAFAGRAAAQEPAATSVLMAASAAADILGRPVAGVTRTEAHLVAGLAAGPFSRVRLDNHGRADETAEARTVGTEDHRHVAGEIDGADGIGVVVDVRRMQPGFAAVGARPLRLRADQAHAGAAGVVVDLPVGREERARCPVRVKKSGAPCGP